MELDDHVDELRQEICDYKNAWGRVTKLLDVPWDASGGKVCEEIRKLQRTVLDCRRLSSSAVNECGFRPDDLFERLAQIERVCRQPPTGPHG